MTETIAIIFFPTCKGSVLLQSRGCLRKKLHLRQVQMLEEEYADPFKHLAGQFPPSRGTEQLDFNPSQILWMHLHFLHFLTDIQSTQMC